MSSSFDFFDAIYCIHLPEHQERWDTALKEFAKVGIADRVIPVSAPRPHVSCTMPALKYPQGELGCWLSHGKALGHALASGAENVLFIEDDIMFFDNSEHRLSLALNELPTDWDLLFLTGSPRSPLNKISPNLSPITGKFLSTVAYALPQRSLMKFHDFRYELLGVTKPLADSPTNRFAQEYNGYAVTPYLCLSHPGTSEIRNAHRDYNNNIAKFWDKFIQE